MKQRGEWGENQAENYLKGQGYTLRERNYRFGRAEVDLIVEKDGELVFVEVKTRKNDAYGTPEAFLSAAQEERILAAAENYLHESEWEGPIRFDIIALLGTAAENVQLQHFEDAFP